MRNNRGIACRMRLTIYRNISQTHISFVKPFSLLASKQGVRVDYDMGGLDWYLTTAVYIAV
jgi:hypothetical protein